MKMKNGAPMTEEKRDIKREEDVAEPMDPYDISDTEEIVSEDGMTENEGAFMHGYEEAHDEDESSEDDMHPLS